MPRDTTIHKILLIGSGPIVIGQGCEFDYSGVQACKALREEGYEVVLINSNPATIMTDPEFAARTYIEPITPEMVEKIIINESPDALLPTLGGQTALNTAMALVKNGVLEKFGVRLIGANAAAIHKGEDRQAFKDAMIKIGLDMPKSGVAHTMEEARAIAAEIGTFPLIIRPAFTLGGSGGGIAYNREEFETVVARGIDMSPVDEVLIDESLLGWKEFEMEVMRDRADNCVVICSIENFDPMGVHTGDSITVAPIQTLTDREYQIMRDASFAVIREIGVETGGSNIQFATHPQTGRMIVIEMNPRVSRSSALASKATGFPIAKIAAKLAVGYTLDEIRNDITRETPASFEPTIDYVVTKVPRFTFEKFPDADPTLTTQMKSVGEAMAIGRTFKESLQKALRSLETGRAGLGADGKDPKIVDRTTLERKLSVPNAERIFWIAVAMRFGRDAGILPARRAGILPAADTEPGQNARAARWQNASATRSHVNLTDTTAGSPPTVFTGFDPSLPDDDLSITQRRLPHWEKIGASYFVTFRLADAVPAELLRDWRDEIDKWSIHHPQPWNANTAFEYQQRFVESREAWLDAGHGSCALKDPGLAEIVAGALRHFDGDRYVLDAFVIMPNHVHLIVKPLGKNKLGDLLHSWKSFSAREINKRLGREGALWMDERHDRIVRSMAELDVFRKYIADNPRKVGKDGLSPDQYILDNRSVLCPADQAVDDDAGILPAADTEPGQNARAARWQMASAAPAGPSFTFEEIHQLTQIDPWFLAQMGQIVEAEEAVAAQALERVRIAADPDYAESKFGKDAHLVSFDELSGFEWQAWPAAEYLRLKRLGFSDRQLASLCCTREEDIRAARKALGIIPTYRLVDTCAAEFEAYTPYYYSTYGDENEARDGTKKKIMILGGGPNRIGQGIEFDYCCVHASFALKELGYETIMVNSNPETVSTDYDTSDKLYFEPLTLEDVLNICDQEKPDGVIVQFGGQTPLNLAGPLEAAGVPIIGTSPQSIEQAEDRKFFAALLDKLGLNQAPSGTATNESEALEIARRIGYPVLVRPSFVLGGRAMRIVYDDPELAQYMRTAVEASPERPVLVDRFLDDATEVDVDLISDGETSVIGAIMEHIEQAGVHSGDSACVIPAFGLSEKIKDEIRTASKSMAKELNVIGLMNIQFAVKDEVLYVLEVNPRASRTAPFVSKAIGIPLPKLAAKIMVGHKLKEMGFTEEIVPAHFSVKEAVFPFVKFPGIDIILGPEMKSTGEVMGIDPDLGLAYAKSQMAAGGALPTKGNIFISVQDRHKTPMVAIAKDYHDLGFKIYATNGTARLIAESGVPVTILHKLADGRRPNVLDLIKNGEIHFIINTPSEAESRSDETKIRSAAVAHRIPIMTTLSGARASVLAIRSLHTKPVEVRALQDYHRT